MEAHANRGIQPTDGPAESAEARRTAMRAEVGAGMAARPRRLPSKYFYDERGSRLFERITRLPEYYLTRAERALLERHAPGWIARMRPRALVELGAGSAAKTRILLNAMREARRRVVYLPVDVSADFLEETAATLSAEYEDVKVEPVVGDIGAGLRLPDPLPRPTVFAFLGSTIGNFEHLEAVRLLSRVRNGMTAADRFLLGVDLRKEPDRIEAAYNDAAGVTAEFNRNVLRVIDAELGADFDPAAFEHHAFYDPDAHRIEMHLVSTRDQRVRIPEVGSFHLERGESIRTEVSHKYDRGSVERLLEASGLRLEKWAAGEGDEFGLAFAARD